MFNEAKKKNIKEREKKKSNNSKKYKVKGLRV